MSGRDARVNSASLKVLNFVYVHRFSNKDWLMGFPRYEIEVCDWSVHFLTQTIYNSQSKSHDRHFSSFSLVSFKFSGCFWFVLKSKMSRNVIDESEVDDSETQEPWQER